MEGVRRTTKFSLIVFGPDKGKQRGDFLIEPGNG